ncbi:MAG: flagellar hook-associated protein FlgL [Gemmatimonadales bacterium]
MRITNNMATQLAIASTTVAREQLDATQTKMSTGHKWQVASEDPTAAANVMQNDAQLRSLTQYQRNVDAANRRVSLQEGALGQLTDLLTRAKELAVSQATSTASATTRQAAGAEVNQLLAQAVQLANTKDGNEYVFGGDASTTTPFSVDTSGAAYTFTVAAVPPTGTRQVDIASGQRITTNLDGTTVFGTAATGPLKVLQDLASALQGGTQPAVTATLDSLDTEMGNAQNLTGETGAIANRLQITSSNITALTNQLTSSNSDLQDVDLASTMTELAGRQTAYQAAMAATARVMNLSLTSYL